MGPAWWIVRICLGLLAVGTLGWFEPLLPASLFADTGGIEITEFLILAGSQAVYLYATLVPLRLAGSEQAVRRGVEAPKLIRESAKDSEVHLYYTPAGERHLCVVVAPTEGEDRFVVTAYLTKNIKKGKERWTS